VLQKHCHALRLLTGVTAADFQSLYVSTLERCRDYLADPSQPDNDTLFCTVLAAVITTLKKRQGYLLPVGADSETVFREQEAWTFAVFTAALLTPIPAVDRMLVAKALLPRHGFAWLYRHPLLFTDWQQYLQGKSSTTLFTTLIDSSLLAKKTATLTPNTPASSSAVTAPTTAPLKPTKNQQQILMPAPTIIKTKEQETSAPNNNVSLPTEIGSLTDCTSDKASDLATIKQSHVKRQATSSTLKTISIPDEAEIKEIDLSTMAAENTTHTTPQTDHQSTRSSTSEEQHVPTYTADEVWHWLAKGITQRQIAVNQPDSLVHRIESGLLVCIPAVIDAFLTAQAKQRSNVDVSSVRQHQQSALTSAIKRHDALVCNEQGARIHSYYLGQWEQRRSIHGVVIPCQALAANTTTIPVNTALQVDPIITT